MRGAVVVLAGVLLAPAFARADVGAKEAVDLDAPDDAVQWGMGPFELRDPFALAQLRASPYARSPRTLEPLDIDVGLRGVWANSYGFGEIDPQDGARCGPLHRFTVDAETRTTDVVFRIGVLPRIELGVEMTAVEWRGGGVLDGLIVGVHELLGLGTLRRDLRPKNAYLIEGIDPSGREASLAHHGVGMGDIAFTPRVLVLRGSDYWPAVALTARIQLPTASSFLGHAGGVAETLSLDASKRLGDLPVILYGGGALTYYDQSTTDGLREERVRSMVYFGVEWEIRPWISLVAHIWQESARETSFFRRTNIPFGNQIQYVAAGVKIEPIDGLRLEVGVQENFHDPNVTADFGLLFNVWWTVD